MTGLPSSPAANPKASFLDRLQGKRVVSLDVLRFIAVSLVIFRHLKPLSCPAGAGPFRIAVHQFQQTAMFGGWVGVDLFFVLSGFLISGLVFREWQERHAVSIGRFLLRRALKIYPAFWFFLAGMLLILYIRHAPVEYATISLRNVLGELLFVQNIWANVFPHTWSLAVEEHFYLMCAAGAWLLLRIRRQNDRDPFKTIPWLFLLVAILCFIIRLKSNLVFRIPQKHAKLLFFGTHIRMDSLFFGVLLSYLWHFRFSAKHQRFLQRCRWFLLFLGVALLAPMFLEDPFSPDAPWIRVYGFILCYLAAGALLLAFVKIFDHTKSPAVRFLGFLGANSYSVYLWHLSGADLASAIVTKKTDSASAWIAYCVLAHASAWAIGITAARLVEFPILKIRDRLLPSHSTQLLAGRPQ